MIGFYVVFDRLLPFFLNLSGESQDNSILGLIENKRSNVVAFDFLFESIFVSWTKVKIQRLTSSFLRMRIKSMPATC